MNFIDWFLVSVGLSSSTKPTRIGASIRCCGSTVQPKLRGCYQGQAAAKQTIHGCEQDRAGCSSDRPASPREITLFWARQDDIMTDGDEDAGTEGRKCYLTMAPSGARQTQTHIHTSDICRGGGHDVDLKVREACSP